MAKPTSSSVWLICASFLLLTLLPFIEAEGNQSNVSIDKIITFSDTDGKNFVDTMSLNGTNIERLSNFSWELIDLFTLNIDGSPSILLSGEHFDSVTPVSESLWEWSIELNISGINCTCQFTTYTDTSSFSEQFEVSTLLVYLGTSNHNPFVDTSSIIISKSDQYQYIIAFDLISQGSFSNGINGIETDGMILNSEVCQTISNTCLDNPVAIELNFTSIQNQILVSIDQQNISIEDGIWLFTFTIKDSFLRESNQFSSRIILDNSPPLVELNSIDKVNESESFLIYAIIDDGYIGSKFTLTWTVTDPEGSSRGLFDEEFYHNTTIELSLNKSGVWNIQILVRDSGNNLVKKNISIMVENTAPVIELKVDGLSIHDGDDIKLNDASSWTIDASSSFDTENEIDEIIFEWFIDNEKLLVNNSIITGEEIDIFNGQQITLIISDEDGQSNTISFSISPPESSEDEDIFTMSSLFFGTGLLVVILVSLKFLFRSKSKDLKLPRWGK